MRLIRRGGERERTEISSPRIEDQKVPKREREREREREGGARSGPKEVVLHEVAKAMRRVAGGSTANTSRTVV